MNKIIFCSHNQHKVNEVKKILESYYEIISLNDIKYFDEIEETGKTLQDNALIKASTIFDKYNLPCFADDSGLEIEALHNEPGVYSARYAGIHKSDSDNIQKVLKNLQNCTNRTAQFRTVICFKNNAQTLYFEGVIKGEINEKEIGINGFGYDPIFIPDNYNQTFAELSADIKNKISHRAIALEKFISYLKQI